MDYMNRKSVGFTIVELLVIIVVIGVLAGISVVAFNGVQTRAANAKRDADLRTLYKAMMVARINTGKTLYAITGTGWTEGPCVTFGENTANIEPRLLPKSHNCWVQYYSGLDSISLASGVNLNGLKAGDMRGNPYSWDENQGEWGCDQYDELYYFNGVDATTVYWDRLPLFESC